MGTWSWAWLLCLALSLALIFNLVVLLVLTLKPKGLARRDPSHLVLISLALADLGMALVVMPLG